MDLLCFKFVQDAFPLTGGEVTRIGPKNDAVVFCARLLKEFDQTH